MKKNLGVIESKIVKAILRELNGRKDVNGRRTIKAIKIHGSMYQEAGTPDIIGCQRDGFGGKFFALEVKRPGGVVSPIQRQRIAEWGEAGARVAEVHSVAEALDVLWMS